MLIKLATFPAVKTLEAFDFEAAPGIPKARIQELSGLAFVERRENVILLGPSGVGKSHLAIALGFGPSRRAARSASSPPPTWCCSWSGHAGRGASTSTCAGRSWVHGC